jgi:hypothetical protein
LFSLKHPGVTPPFSENYKMSKTKPAVTESKMRMVALSVDGKFETGFVIQVPEDATDDEIEELIPDLICRGAGTRLEPEEITEIRLDNEGTVSMDNAESPASEITTKLERTPAGELVITETITSKEVEKIVEETTAKLENRYGTISVVVLIQKSAAGEFSKDVLVFHNRNAETAKSILTDAWTKLDEGR